MHSLRPRRHDGETGVTPRLWVDSHTDEPMKAEILHLSRIQWHYFITLTHRGEIPSDARLQRMLNGYFAEAGRIVGVRNDRLLYAVRREAGERGGRLHEHALLAADRGHSPTPQHCYRLRHVWSDVIKAGMADVRIFAGGLDSIGYLTKGADSYESGKFGLDTSVVTLSDAVLRLVMHKRRRETR